MTKKSLKIGGAVERLVRDALVGLFALLIVGMIGHSEAIAQNYPSRSIRIIVPFTAGGGNDVLGRTVAQKLQEAWGQPVVVENKPGAGGNIGADLVAKSPADGYTLLIAANNILSINPTLNDGTPFDPLKDFAPISLVGTIPVLLAVPSTLPVKSVKELISLAKSDPEKLTFGSAGYGTPQHLSGDLFASMAGVKMQHVPYRGASPMITDLISGQVQLAFGAINTMLPLVKDRKLRAVAVTSDKRLPYLQDVPTVSEDLPGFETDIWIALVAPAGTPRDVVVKINEEVRRIFTLPDVRERLAAQGIEPKTSTPDDLTALVKSDLARWAKVIKDTGEKSKQ
ncbi:Bug family tripartite tricarboxylate transporter substrate binding protein [Pseudorhodoplanes sinuspersici]|nr:tripartite tricarboxylate transporter substrate binding protein [Pseudorhodoplanes sinuspersici]RKE68226.1 tripartite-type tricarboxylate transporter receptor subunit TctC [Pseudorhodoplanes sinuspersici]